MLTGTISANDLAALAGVSTRWIAKLFRDGIIPAPKAGLYPAEETIKALFKYFRAASEGVGESYSSERARLTKSKADIAELERSRLMGEVVPVGEMIAVNTTIVTGVRDRLLQVPTKLAARLAITTKAFDAEQIVRTGIDEALEDLSRLTVISARPVRPSRGRPRSGDNTLNT